VARFYCLFPNISDVDIGQAKVTKEVIAKVREHVGPVASFKDVIIVPRLPKTRSGKIARNTLAAIAAGQSYKVSTLSFCLFYSTAIISILLQMLIESSNLIYSLISQLVDYQSINRSVSQSVS